jgi:hypothetical protein
LLAILFAVSAAPAMAVGQRPATLPPCSTAPTGHPCTPAPPAPSCATTPTGHPCLPASCTPADLYALWVVEFQQSQRVARQQTLIARKDARIAHQARIIERLRQRLASR